MKCSCGEPVRDAQCFKCGEWHDNYGFDSWPDMPKPKPTPRGADPVPESVDECEFGYEEYQWRLRQAGL